MARTVGGKPKALEVKRSIDYEDYIIAKMCDGTFRIWYDDPNIWFSAADKEDAIAKIEALKKMVKPKSKRTVQPRIVAKPVEVKKSNRTIKAKVAPPKIETPKEEFPRGGHIKNPISTCPKRAQFEKGGNWWVECVMCAYHCQFNVSCPTYRDFLAGRRERIKLMNNGG